MKSDTELNYDIGHKIGLKAIDALALKTQAPTPIHFIGALTALLQCICFFEKDKAKVIDMFNVSLETALDGNAKQAAVNAARSH